MCSAPVDNAPWKYKLIESLSDDTQLRIGTADVMHCLCMWKYNSRTYSFQFGK